MRTNEDILRATAGYHQGTVVKGTRGELAQLFAAGLVGVSGGLTRKGSILAERVQNAQLDELFR
jgi:hypothetical protein